jgi:hypothetical protein
MVFLKWVDSGKKYTTTGGLFGDFIIVRLGPDQWGFHNTKDKTNNNIDYNNLVILPGSVIHGIDGDISHIAIQDMKVESTLSGGKRQSYRNKNRKKFRKSKKSKKPFKKRTIKRKHR